VEIEPTVLDGRYELGRLLGQGGFGAVYEARDLKFPDMKLAVKMLHADNAEAREALKAEIRHLSQINDPYVLRTTDWGEHGDSIFMVTEFVNGKTLTELKDEHWKQNGPGAGFDPLFAVDIGHWIARSLRAVHAAGIVHRDLTPNNVIISLHGTGHTATVHALKLIDFGLASARGVARSVAEGTPHYVPPEVLLRKPVSPNTDIYGLGCILFELVMGEPPYPSNEPQVVVEQHCSPDPPPRMHSGNDEFDDLVARMMSKNPIERADSTSEVLDLLSRISAEFQRSRTVRRAAGPLLPAAPDAETRKLPGPVAVSTDELGVVPLPQVPEMKELLPSNRRPLMIGAAILAVIALAFVASRLGPAEKPPEVAVAPQAEVAPVAVVAPVPPPAPIEPVPVPPDELAPLAKVEPPKPKPAVKPVEPKITCEPTHEWKQMMFGNLAAVETYANKMSALEVSQESDRVGRIVNEAQTPKECARAIAEFEALKNRAIK
jgi:eukaryotic-like serine/threonine-protein kinase